MPDKIRFWLDRTQTPVGELVIIASEQRTLRMIGWSTDSDIQTKLLPAAVLETKRDPHGFTTALHDYFAGDLHIIDQLPASAPGTAFQQSVWHLLRQIPCSTTISYGEVAKRLGNPNAVRAVGLANGANPIGIVVPCHRVIGANGSLTGYGGGIERKRWLLAHEQTNSQTVLPYD